MSDVIVIGGGIAGLAAGYRLMKLGADVQVIERGAAPGGHTRTVQREGWRHELGPNSFLGNANDLFSLAQEVGLTPVEARPGAAKKRFLFIDGALRAVPSDPLAAISSPLLPMSAKLRVLAEPVTGSVPSEDESVRAFFEQHLGREVTSRFVDAFVSGIYAGDISRIGMAAAFPKVFELAKTHGSLLRGALHLMKSRPKRPSRRGTYSFAGGLGDLPDALASALGSRLQLGVETDLRQTATGFTVNGMPTNSVILATPSYVSAALVEDFAPTLAMALVGIHYNPIAGVHLLFPKSAVPRSLEGFGFLVPRREGVRTLGCIWSSAMFEVCKDDHVALTCFIGGAHDAGAVDATDEALVAAVRQDLLKTMGIHGAPVDAVVVKHRRAIPEYGLKHLAVRAEIDQLTGELPGLALTGNYLEGVSMNDAIAHADRTARQVHAQRKAQGQAA